MKRIAAVIILLLCLSTGAVYAQTDFCYTYTNYPLYDWANVNFGFGTDTYGHPVREGRTPYQFVTAAPLQGQYTILHNTIGMNPVWTEITTTEHSVDDQSYMMVVNGAAVQADDFYQTDLGYLCPKTTYKLSQPVFNLFKGSNGILPNLTFTVCTASGRVLKTINTGNIPYDGQWRSFLLEFTTDDVSVHVPREDILIKITKNAAGSTGNVFALDRLTYLPNYPTITGDINGTGLRSITECAGTDHHYTLHADITGDYLHARHIWRVSYNSYGQFTDIPGETNNTLNVDVSAQTLGTIRYQYTSAEGDNLDCDNCRAGSPALTININPQPIANAFNDISGCEGEPLNISPSTANYKGYNYDWRGPNNFYSGLPSPVIPEAHLSDAGTYHVIITSAEGCSVSGDIKVTINPKINVTAGNDANICAGSSTQLRAVANGAISYSWLPISGLSNPDVANPVASPAITTIYTVKATNAYGCTSSAAITVNVAHPPTVDAGTDQQITEGDHITLQGKISGSNYSYYWTPAENLSSNNSLTPMASPVKDVTYTLHVKDGNACAPEITDDVFIKVYKKVTVPNVFSPNGDGVNDDWAIAGIDFYPTATIQIFARYGALVYQSTGYPKNWDGNLNGKPLPQGTYYYKIDLKNGKVLSGSVSIIR